MKFQLEEGVAYRVDEDIKEKIHSSIDNNDAEKVLIACMEELNYKRIQKTMEFLDWNWFHSKTETGVPNYSEMQDCIQGLAKDCWEMYTKDLNNPDEPLDMTAYHRWAAETGGFMVSLETYENNVYCWTIHFILESWREDNYKEDSSATQE